MSQSTNSDDEWVRGDAHTDTVGGFFSIFKRGMTGIYQHCGEQHLHRYLAESISAIRTHLERIKLGSTIASALAARSKDPAGSA